VLAAAVVIWAGLVGVGFSRIAGFETTPGQQGPAPATWPTASVLPRYDGHRTLVMFVHPKCVCTRASLTELNAIMVGRPAATDALVVFVRPAGVAADWERTDTWASVARIPQTTRLVDAGGEEARRFGAATSGQALLYDAAGTRRFAGGITDSRGHAGDNVGRRSIVALLGGTTPLDAGHAVYGCPLHDAPRGAVPTESSTP
jgi:hypothetical protein